ncbi:MAG: CheR family methyltransferase, partial [Myxococcota bacterium]
IFCRNVMIYFDPETTAHIVSKLYEVLEVGGFLFVGESESIRDREGRFDYVQASVYRKLA